MLVEIPAQVGFDRQRRRRHRAPPDREQACLEDPEEHRQADQRVHAGTVVMGDRAVDEFRCDDRQDRLHHHCAGRDDEHEDQVPAIRTEPGPQPQQVFERSIPSLVALV